MPYTAPDSARIIVRPFTGSFGLKNFASGAEEPLVENHSPEPTKHEPKTARRENWGPPGGGGGGGGGGGPSMGGASPGALPQSPPPPARAASGLRVRLQYKRT